MTSDVSDWIDKAIPAGSGRYYALLHSDKTLVQKQKLLVALISIFSTLGFQSREIEVAKHKLDWWRQELKKDSFSHPVMVALDQTGITADNRNQLTRLLNAYGSLLEQGSPSGDDQNKRFHLDTGAAASHLLCNCDTEISVLNETGSILSRFRCLRYLRQHVDSGLLCLRLSSLEAADISPALLTPKSDNKEVQNFITHALNDLQNDMDKGLKSLTKHIASEGVEPSNYKALYIYLHLQSRLLQVLCKDGSSVLDEVSRLTPIRNYWYALGASRKFDKLC